MPEKKSFILYIDNKEVFDILSDAQLGRLTRLLIDFADTRTLESNIDDAAVNVAYRFMTTQMKRDIEKYDLVCQRRSEAGKKGMASRWNNKDNKNNKAKQPKTNDNKDKQTITKITDNDNVNDNDNDILSLSYDNDNNSQPCTAAGAAAQADSENSIRYGRIIGGSQTIIDEDGYEVIPIDPNDDTWA